MLSVSVFPFSYVTVSLIVHLRDFEHLMEMRNVFFTLPVFLFFFFLVTTVERGVEVFAHHALDRWNLQQQVLP